MRSRYVGPGSLEAVAEPLPGERAGEVVIYIGEVDARTASRFLSRVAESTDQTIELEFSSSQAREVSSRQAATWLSTMTDSSTSA
jgi:hypothetical protein